MSSPRDPKKKEKIAKDPLLMSFSFLTGRELAGRAAPVKKTWHEVAAEKKLWCQNLQRDFHIQKDFAEKMQEPQLFYSHLTELRTTDPLKFRRIYLSHQIAKYDDSIFTAKSPVKKEYPIGSYIRLSDAQINLIKIAVSGDLKTLQAYEKENEVPVISSVVTTALQYGAKSDCASYLINKVLNPDKRRNFTSADLIRAACKGANLEGLPPLVKEHIDDPDISLLPAIESKTSDPIRQLELVQYLMEKCEMEDGWGECELLRAAVSSGNIRVIDYLIKQQNIHPTDDALFVLMDLIRTEKTTGFERGIAYYLVNECKVDPTLLSDNVLPARSTMQQHFPELMQEAEQKKRHQP